MSETTETRYYEAEKWSLFLVETYDTPDLSENEGNRYVLEVKWASINLDEMDEEWKNGCVLSPCDQKTNEEFGGGQWYEWVGFCLDGFETGSSSLCFSDKETERKYNELMASDERYEGLDPDEIFAELGGGMETVMYFRLERSDDHYRWDITKDFEKYLSEPKEYTQDLGSLIVDEQDIKEIEKDWSAWILKQAKGGYIEADGLFDEEGERI